MAGGIDWFRWHHGSVTDPKFALVAKKAGASVAEVIAVWACLLEAASAAESRGDPGAIDFESIDCLLGTQDGMARRIYERMRERSLLDGETGRIAAWDKRQPKKEDESAADRKRRQREREHELQLAQSHAASRDVTLSHAAVTLGHDRGEESREEIKITSLTKREPAEIGPPLRGVGENETPEPDAKPTPYGAITQALRKAGIQRCNPGHLTFRALVDAGATADEFIAYADKALTKSDPFAYLLSVVERARRDAKETAGAVQRGSMAPPDTGRAAVDATAAYLAQQEAHGKAIDSPETRALAAAALASLGVRRVASG